MRLASNYSGLSVREVGKLTKIVTDVEKGERKDNIVIKGCRIEGKMEKEWVKDLLKEKLGVGFYFVD